MAKANADALTREGAGNWRTKDGRFLIRGESGAHWYVVDAMRRDAFGLELVTGPYSTINEAKAAIAGARDEMPDSAEPAAAAGAEALPGAAAEAEVAGAAGPRTSRARRPASGEPAVPAAPAAGALKAQEAPKLERVRDLPPPRPAATKGGATAADDLAQAASPVSSAIQAKTPPAPPDPDWLARLPESERRRARRTIAELDRIGIADAAGVTRRDVSADTPEVARSLLRRRLAAIAERSADPDLARAVLGEAVRLVSITGHDPDAAELAGWALVETGRSTPPRRILLDRDDLEKVPDQPARPDVRRRTTGR